ncbi:MAG: polysaccharide deacetylase family protein, partial [Candidatus Methanofastidiosia archaeon]
MKINEFFERYSMIFVLSLAFSLTLIPKRYEMPLTFEDWYHLRILKDYLHTFPMKFDFYFLSSLAFLFINSIFEVSLVDFSRFFPSLLYLSSLYLWYLILKIFNSKVALVSSFFLLTSKTFLDTSLIFHPPSLALMLYLLGILFFLKRRFILTFLVGLTLIMTHEFISISFLLSIIFLSFLERRKFHIFIISGCLALTLFLLSSTELKPMEISMKNLQVLILDLGIPHLFLAFLAILFLRRKIFEDRFLVLLSLPILISVTLTSNYVLFSLPITILSSRFLAGALSSIKTLKFKSSLTFFVLLISFAPSFKLLYDLEPVEMESFHPSLFLGNSSLREVVAFDESRILIFDVTTENEFLSERKEYLKDDLELIYKLDSDILDKYWVRYIYFGEKERVTFSKTSLRKVGVDKLFSGEAEIFDLYPEVVYVLITIDTERDLPPVLFSYHGVEEGVPLILELLKRYEVRATFFVTGEVIESYPEVISKILQNHEVGLHGMFHEDFTLLEKEEKR